MYMGSPLRPWGFWRSLFSCARLLLGSLPLGFTLGHLLLILWVNSAFLSKFIVKDLCPKLSLLSRVCWEHRLQIGLSGVPQLLSLCLSQIALPVSRLWSALEPWILTSWNGEQPVSLKMLSFPTPEMDPPGEEPFLEDTLLSIHPAFDEQIQGGRVGHWRPFLIPCGLEVGRS